MRRRVRGRGLALRGQPRLARGRRGVGVRPVRGSTWTRSTRAGCVSPAPATCTPPGSRRRATPPSCPPATSGSSRPRRCTPTPRSRPPRMPSRTERSPRCRTGSATRRRSRRTSSRVIRGTTFPAGKIFEPGVVQWDVKGDTTFGPFEPSPAPGRRSSGSRTPARAAGCRRRRSRTPAAPNGGR